MSPTTTPSVYTSLDAAKAAQSGAFLTAWPADETVISLPSLKGLSLETGYRKSSSGGASQNSSTESLPQSTTTAPSTP
ncbi:hypothetical protein MGU_11739 [Metarhizium guizhouense ARSEF 977]|uniref:Uncharacterized protein n=1 Tax=Metarhizium guizhouense (strain ARSEF 977) TaxID=1276136 RepID=A0A0B4GMA9_METGA|nr:hypothetical protein MGU_11739 [Metarhizium guizhouense ARSEF 977]